MEKEAFILSFDFEHMNYYIESKETTLAKTIKVGVTGGIGSGKSLVCQLFSIYGIPCYYADKEAKKLMVKDHELVLNITNLLGKEAYNDDATLNRAFIAQKVFNDRALLAQLNQLVHPAVKNDFNRWSDEQNSPFVLEESAILIEEGLYTSFDKIILVTAALDKKINRIKQRNNWNESEILQRMNNQWTDEKKLAFAHFVIDNSEKQSLILQIDKIYHELIN